MDLSETIYILKLCDERKYTLNIHLLQKLGYYFICKSFYSLLPNNERFAKMIFLKVVDIVEE